MNKNSLSGIIDKIQVQRLPDWRQALVYEAYAYLKPQARGFTQSHAIYGDCDGSGTADSESLAIEIAVTEALERWAFYTVSATTLDRKYIGLDKNNSTTGFAADRRFAIRARRRALAEASERWALRNWWTNQGGAICIEEKPDLNLQFWILQSPHPRVTVVLALQRLENLLHPYIYGFAGAHGLSARRRLAKAKDRALLELNRNKRNLLLADWQKLRPANLIERRLCFFASETGFQLVKEKLNAAQNIPITRRGLQLIVDQRVHGEWDKWIKVWRCLYESVTTDVIDETSEQVFEF